MVNTKNNFKNAVEIAEEYGWSLMIEDLCFSFNKFSPAGQDFHVEVYAATLNELAAELYKWYLGFDASEETYYWLDTTGHGKNGAPHDMKDAYEDMEWCGNEVEILATAFQEIAWEEAKHK